MSVSRDATLTRRFIDCVWWVRYSDLPASLIAPSRDMLAGLAVMPGSAASWPVMVSLALA